MYVGDYSPEGTCNAFLMHETLNCGNYGEAKVLTLRCLFFTNPEQDIS